jgi:hypothetical protein
MNPRRRSGSVGGGDDSWGQRRPPGKQTQPVVKCVSQGYAAPFEVVEFVALRQILPAQQAP